MIYMFIVHQLHNHELWIDRGITQHLHDIDSLVSCVLISIQFGIVILFFLFGHCNSRRMKNRLIAEWKMENHSA